MGARLLRRRELSRQDGLGAVNDVIYDLSPEGGEWTPRTRERVCALLEEISAGLDKPSAARANLGLLFVVLSRGGETAAEVARPILLEKIQVMCRDPRHKNERFLTRILFMLERYAPWRLEAVAREAIHLWGDDHFRAAGGFLDRRELYKRGLAPSVKDILGRQIVEAGNGSDWSALKRALELYHEVK